MSASSTTTVKVPRSVVATLRKLMRRGIGPTRPMGRRKPVSLGQAITWLACDELERQTSLAGAEPSDVAEVAEEAVAAR